MITPTRSPAVDKQHATLVVSDGTHGMSTNWVTCYLDRIPAGDVKEG
jgi:hypothetical protein